MPTAPHRLRARIAILITHALAAYAVTVSISLAREVIQLSTTDWPPYTGADLPDGGAASGVVRAAFAKAGYQVAITYDRWPRAIEMARKSIDDVIGYYPGYHCRHREGFSASRPIGRGPLGFAERIDAPLVWTSLDDIGERKLKIGTVAGYANTDEFDSKVGTGWIHAIPSPDDATNLGKLLRKRLDAVVVDQLVFQYLKATEPALRQRAHELRFNERLLEDKTLYLCLRDDASGTRLMQAFNRGLEGVDADRIFQIHMEQIRGQPRRSE